MELNDVKKVLEALLFITEEPIPLKTLQALFDPPIEKEQLQLLLESLSADYLSHNSALEVREIAGGWQLSTRTEFAPFIRKLFKDRLTYRLSSSAMETLSIVAYKQPITRAEIEEIRGVEVTAVLDTLVERKLLRIAGRKETVGRPLLYGTTPDFLRAFGLKGLEDLPSIESLIPSVVGGMEAESPLETVPDGNSPLQSEDASPQPPAEPAAANTESVESQN